MTVIPNSEKHRTPFGLRDGRMLEPSEVASGLACGCVCPECGARLVARKGEIRVDHFAHYQRVATLRCVESAIHAAAKQVLMEANWIRIPIMRPLVSGKTSYGQLHWITETLSEERIVRFDYSRDEVWEPSINVRPDVIGYRKDRRLLVEMYFTHAVDDNKKEKLTQLALPAIEIDLSDLNTATTFAALRQRVLEETACKQWLFYPGEKQWLDAMQVQLKSEIDALNAQYEQESLQRERERKLEQEARLLREKARAKREEEKRIWHENEDAKYRAIPRAEKEAHLRKSLNITHKWPYYLNKEFAEASVINELPRIWQSALFLRFVYKKGKATENLSAYRISGWIKGRFGLVDDRKGGAYPAVHRYLAYLRACGFLEEEYHYDDHCYKVIHDELNPPTPYKNKSATVAPTTSFSPPLSSPLSQNIDRVSLIWSASWPDRKASVKSATELLGDVPYKDCVLDAISRLQPGNRPANPHDLATILEKQGVPPSVTADLLCKLHIAVGRRY